MLGRSRVLTLPSFLLDRARVGWPQSDRRIALLSEMQRRGQTERYPLSLRGHAAAAAA
jgi:hypothetical protein